MRHSSVGTEDLSTTDFGEDSRSLEPESEAGISDYIGHREKRNAYRLLVRNPKRKNR
jgi:hypothetical protein